LSTVPGALGKGIDECRRRQALLDVRFTRQKFEVGEQHLDHAGAVDEIGNVGLGDRAPDGLELPADWQILKAEAEPNCFHAVLFYQRAAVDPIVALALDRESRPR
jgi:hypothetical protein